MRPNPIRWLVPAALAVLIALIVYTAWLGDDAYITFRVIDNFRHGYGLRWNVAERVQAFTHPLWLFVLAGGWSLTGEPYFSSLIISIVCSAAAAWTLARTAADARLGALAIGVLAVSRSFVDYATSGLENPLSFLLLAIFLAGYWSTVRSPRRVGALIAVAALLAANRLDLVVLVGPAVAHLMMTSPRGSWRWIAIGTLPLVLWEIFSVVYFGFALPNTAYAKLPPNVSVHELVAQGLVYLGESLRHDPVTLVAIGVAVAVTVARPVVKRETVTLGLIAYLAYVLRVGGDFMSDRFLSVPFLAAVALMASPVDGVSLRLRATLLGVLIALGLATGFRSTLHVPTPDDAGASMGASGVNDERYLYAPNTRLIAAIRDGHAPVPGSVQSGLKLRRNGSAPFGWIAIGMIGYGAGPGVFIVDKVALADPLLARLPAMQPWKIGHFERKIPEGYLETISTGESHFADPDLARYYETLSLVTRGSIWSLARWRAILALNLGTLRPPRLHHE